MPPSSGGADAVPEWPLGSGLPTILGPVGYFREFGWAIRGTETTHPTTLDDSENALAS